jgi:hypothetical protein
MFRHAPEPGRASRRQPPRGTSGCLHKFGGLGYVGFAEEVRAQERDMEVRFGYVIVCTVTGSTQAGMVVGFAADGRERNVIGIDASCTPAQTKAQVLDSAQKTSDLIGGRSITVDDIAEGGIRLPGLRRAVERNARGDPPVSSVRGHDHRPGTRGQVDAGHDRPGAERLLS